MARGSRSSTSVINFPGGGGGTSIVTIIIGIIAIIALVYFFKKNPNFIKNLLGGGGKIGAAVGDSKPGPNIYPSLGDIPRSGDFGLSWANSDTSHRDNVSFPCDKCNRETTWFFIPGTGGGGGSTGEDVTVKMGSHGGKSDQTALIGFRGIPYSGGGGEWKSEGPHGTDAGVSGTATGSVDLTGDQPMGIKGISWNIDPAGTQHHEIWTSTDNGANWTMAAQFEGTTEGSNALTCPIPPDGEGNCQDTLRIDGVQGYEFQRRSMVEIQGGVEPVGGGTPPTEIPTQNREGGDSEGGGGGGGDEEPAPTDGGDGDGDGDGGDGEDGEDGPAAGGGGVKSCDEPSCACNDGRTLTMSGSQTCSTDCTRLCGGTAALVRELMRIRTRRGNLGKRVMYNKMFNRYSETRQLYDDVIVGRAGTARICM